MQRYIEIAYGDERGQPSIRNMIIQKEDLPKYIQDKKELYRSYYTYDADIIEHKKVYKTVSSYKGKYYLDRIILDVDKHEGLGEQRRELTDEEVLNKTKRMVQHLEEEWQLDRYQISIWYSGTGYHLSFPDIFHFEPSNFLPDEVKFTFSKYFPEMDTMPLMKTGLIRVGYSLNAKSGRYKIPLTYDELQNLTASEIIELSRSNEPRKLERDDTEYSIPDFRHLIIKNVQKREQEKINQEPTKIVTCAQKMFLEGSQKGSGHNVMLAMVSSWRLSGMPLEACIILAKQWASGRTEAEWAPYQVEKQVRYIWEKGYTPGCDHPVRQKYCDEKCIYYKNKNYVQEVYDIKSLERNYVMTVKSDLKNKSINLNGTLFKLKNDFMLVPEDVVYIMGNKGIGKTALAQNLAVNSPLKTLYLNLEFSGGLLYRRFCQIKHQLPKAEVDMHYKLHNNSLSEGLEHIYVLDVSPNLNSIKGIIADVEPGLVIIDTVEDIIVPGSKGIFDITDAVGRGLKQIAKSMKVIIIGIQHITKSASVDEKGRPKELNLHSGKGSSSQAQKADKVFSVEGIRENNLRLVRTLAARDEEPFQVSVEFDKNTFRMKQITY